MSVLLTAAVHISSYDQTSRSVIIMSGKTASYTCNDFKFNDSLVHTTRTLDRYFTSQFRCEDHIYNVY